jgi:hypothetical protein
MGILAGIELLMCVADVWPDAMDYNLMKLPIQLAQTRGR